MFPLKNYGDAVKLFSLPHPHNKKYFIVLSNDLSVKIRNRFQNEDTTTSSLRKVEI